MPDQQSLTFYVFRFTHDVPEEKPDAAFAH
jgi:hypothetical protein